VGLLLVFYAKTNLEKHGEEMNFFGWFMVEEELKTLWDCASTIWYSNFAIFFHPFASWRKPLFIARMEA
jgi:hypothetical protein